MQSTDVAVRVRSTDVSVTRTKGQTVGAVDDGFHGAKEHILTVDPKHAMLAGGFVHSPELTVCYSVWPYLRHLGYIVYAIVLQVVLGQAWAFPNSEPGEAPCPANANMCGLEASLNQASGHFRLLIAFVLGGFVASTVGMWRQRRQNYASLCGSTRNLCVQIQASLAWDESGETTKLRETLSRWVLLAYELAVLKPRNAMDSDRARDHLKAVGLLEADEWEKMVPGDRHTTVFFWILAKCRQQATETGGKLRSERAWALETIAEAVGVMRSQANDLMSSLDRDDPFPYLSLTTFLVNVNVLLFTSWKGVEWAAWFYKSGGGIYRAPKMYVEILVLFVWNLSYQAMYDLSYVLHNPFGARRIDVAHEVIAAGIRKLATSLAHAGEHIPQTFRDAK